LYTRGGSVKREAEAARGVDEDVEAARGAGGGAGAACGVGWGVGAGMARRQAPKYLQ
jgi:hypothetical protein